MARASATKTTTKTKPVIVEAEVTQNPVIVDELDFAARMRSKIEIAVTELFAEQGFAVPSWKRQLVAFVGSFAVGFGVGSVFNVIISVMMNAIFALTSSMFLVYTLWIVGMLAAAYFALKAGQKVGMYIVSGNIDGDVQRLKAKVSGWFTRKPAQPLTAA